MAVYRIPEFLHVDNKIILEISCVFGGCQNVFGNCSELEQVSPAPRCHRNGFTDASLYGLVIGEGAVEDPAQQVLEPQFIIADFRFSQRL